MRAEERTFVAVKPDGVQRGLVGEVIKRLETKGYKIVAMKMQQMHKQKHITKNTKTNHSSLDLFNIFKVVQLLQW